ncbi:MAG TPA: substrate-binding domain-containing protein, partial [Allosphingosinicella sp.]
MKTTSAVAAIALAAVAAAPLSAASRRSIRIVGSSTVYPFAGAVAERFARANPAVPAPITESTGTGAGMKLFCAGVGERFPDIENASRRMKASEAKLCAQNGVSKITEIQVGLDGIVLAGGTGSPQLALTTRDIYAALAATPWGKANRA